MSSILDALKKLEDEKAQVEADPDDIEVNVDDARHDLVGRSVMGDRIEVRMKPAAMLAIAGGFAVLLVALSVMIAIVFSGGGQERAVVAQATESTVVGDDPLTMNPAPAPVEVSIPLDSSGDEGAGASAAPLVSPAAPEVKPDVSAAWREDKALQPAPQTRKPETPRPEANRQASGRANTPAQSVPTVAASVEPVSTPEAPVTMVVDLPPPVPESRTTSAIASNPEGAGPDADLPGVVSRDRQVVHSLVVPSERVDVGREPDVALPGKVVVNQLPVLSQTARTRHDLGDIIVNIVSPATDIKPVASAVINRMKVFEGERITGTSAKLLQVEPNGVVLEIAGTGERYFLPH